MAHIISITDLASPELDIYARLTENQLLRRDDPSEALFIAESPLVIERALEAGYEPVSALMEEKVSEAESTIVEKLGDIPVYTASFDVLTKLTGFNLTRGMLSGMRRKKLPSVAELCRDKRRIAVLEGVVNPTNVGAIIRSAAALGMEAVVLTKDCSDPFYRRALRVSMGTALQIPWTYFEHDDEPLDELKRLGFKTVAMALRDDSYAVDSPQLKKEYRLAVVLGSEGPGLKNETIDSCDYTVRIPMSHGVDSLNVAAAGAVAFWELGRL